LVDIANLYHPRNLWALSASLVLIHVVNIYILERISMEYLLFDIYKRISMEHLLFDYLVEHPIGKLNVCDKKVFLQHVYYGNPVLMSLTVLPNL
jgi:hypothetical protein